MVAYQYGTQLPRIKCIKQEEEGVFRNTRMASTWRPLPSGLVVLGAMFGVTDVTGPVRDMQDGDTLTVYPDAAVLGGGLPGVQKSLVVVVQHNGSVRVLACMESAKEVVSIA